MIRDPSILTKVQKRLTIFVETMDDEELSVPLLKVVASSISFPELSRGTDGTGESIVRSRVAKMTPKVLALLAWFVLERMPPNSLGGDKNILSPRVVGEATRGPGFSTTIMRAQVCARRGRICVDQ